MAKYQIFTDSCSDLSTAERKQYGIEYVYMGLVVDGEEYPADLDWKAYTPEEFYGWLSAGKKVKTTQVTIPEFIEKFTPFLEKGYDIVYLACAEALSGSVNVCRLAAEELKEKFPDRKIVAVNTCCGAYTEGMIVKYAAIEAKRNNFTLDQLVEYVEKNKNRVNQFATVDTLKYLKEAGRIKGTAAFFGDIIGIKPIFISDVKGNNFVVEKVRGTKASLDALFEGVKKTIDKEKCPSVMIAQGMCMERAQLLKQRIEAELNVPAEITWIGPIVGTTCGPGVISTFCFGREVTRYDGDGIASGY